MEETMRRALIGFAVGLTVLLGALAPTFVSTPASAYYYHHATTPIGITATITVISTITIITTRRHHYRYW